MFISFIRLIGHCCRAASVTYYLIMPPLPAYFELYRIPPIRAIRFDTPEFRCAVLLPLPLLLEICQYNMNTLCVYAASRHYAYTRHADYEMRCHCYFTLRCRAPLVFALLGRQHISRLRSLPLEIEMLFRVTDAFERLSPRFVAAYFATTSPDYFAFATIACSPLRQFRHLIFAAYAAIICHTRYQLSPSPLRSLMPSC